MASFKVKQEFCPLCGAIFPHLQPTGNIDCYTCKDSFRAEDMRFADIDFSIHFNSYDPTLLKKPIEIKKEKDEEGPTVEKKCPKCNNDRMSYSTIQLRSADEGQTVFFTCTNCKYKESENS